MAPGPDPGLTCRTRRRYAHAAGQVKEAVAVCLALGFEIGRCKWRSQERPSCFSRPVL